MSRKNPIRTEIGNSTPDRITVRGKDVATELIGKLDFVDMILFAHSGRTCSTAEKAMLNAILVAVMDHGFTPSSIAARMTFLGAPEAPQAAVAAGLLGAGSVFLGAMDNSARMLLAAAEGLGDGASDEAVAAAAEALFDDAHGRRQPLYGMGHNLHVNGDPRVPALIAVSRENGFFGRHWQLLLALEAVIARRGKRPLPINAAGAIAAMICDMGLPTDLARGLALIARSAGIVAHLNEERSQPIGKALWDLVLREDERNELPG